MGISADFITLHNLYNAAYCMFEYRSDQTQFGSAEHWESPDELKGQLKTLGMVIGDCDDFASFAVMEARASGLPARFVLCQTEVGDMHLVAEIEGWIIDNRQSDVVRRDDLEYKWIAISGFKSGDAWHAIK